MARQFSVNSLSGGVRFFVLTGIYFFTYPYMLHSLGPQRFGLWALGLAVSQWIAAGDLGIAGTLLKFIPEHWDSRSIERINELTTAGMVILSVAGLSLVTLVWLLRFRLLSLLNIPLEYRAEMMWLIWGMPAVFFLNLTATGLTSVLNGIQRMDVSNFIYSAVMGVNGAGIFFVLSRRYGLIGLMANAGFAAFLWIVITLGALKILVPDFGLVPRRLRRSDIRCLMQFGLNLQGAMIAGALAIPTVRVLLSRYVSLAAVSYFELASGMALQARSLFQTVMLPLVPASSQLAVRHDMEGVAGLYRISSRFLLFSALPAGLLITAIAPNFTRLWLGSAEGAVASTLILLALGWTANCASIPAYFVIQGLGFPKYQMYCLTVFEVLTASLGYGLVKVFGYYGAVVGIVIAMVVAAVYIIERFHRLMGYPLGDLIDLKDLKVGLVNLGLFVPFLLILRGREISSLLHLVLVAVLYVAIYGVLIIALHCVPESELPIARQFLPRSLLRVLFGRAALSN